MAPSPDTVVAFAAIVDQEIPPLAIPPPMIPLASSVSSSPRISFSDEEITLVTALFEAPPSPAMPAPARPSRFTEDLDDDSAAIVVDDHLQTLLAAHDVHQAQRAASSTPPAGPSAPGEYKPRAMATVPIARPATSDSTTSTLHGTIHQASSAAVSRATPVYITAGPKAAAALAAARGQPAPQPTSSSKTLDLFRKPSIFSRRRSSAAAAGISISVPTPVPDTRQPAPKTPALSLASPPPPSSYRAPVSRRQSTSPAPELPVRRRPTVPAWKRHSMATTASAYYTPLTSPMPALSKTTTAVSHRRGDSGYASAAGSSGSASEDEGCSSGGSRAASPRVVAVLRGAEKRRSAVLTPASPRDGRQRHSAVVDDGSWIAAVQDMVAEDRARAARKRDPLGSVVGFFRGGGRRASVAL